MAAPTTSSIRLSPIDLLLDPSILDGEENRVFVMVLSPSVDLNPQVFYGGQTATEHLCSVLTNVCQLFKTDQDRRRLVVPQLFKQTTQADIALFESIPLDAFPADHPFRSNGAIELLQEYVFPPKTLSSRIQFQKKPDVISHPSVMIRSRCCLIGAKQNCYYRMPDRLDISHQTASSIEEVLLNPTTGYGIAYDPNRNIWATTQALRELLFPPCQE